MFSGLCEGGNVFPISNHHLSADRHGLVAKGGVPAFVCLFVCFVKKRLPDAAT